MSADVSRHLTANRWRNRLEVVLVAGVYFVLLGFLASYLAEYGRNLPYQDDWEMVSVLSGHDPVTVGWFFALQNEHRLPLARLVILALFRGVGDLRFVMLVTIVLHAVIAYALIRCAREVRGRTSVVDVVFPLALMSPAHAENLFFTIQLFFVSAPFLVAGIVTLAVRDRWRASLGGVLALGAMLVALPLNGMSGVVMSAPLAVWFIAAARSRLRDRDAHARRDWILLLVSVGVTAMAAVLYFWGFRRPASKSATFSLFETLRTSLEALSMAFGPAGISAWPWSAVLVLVLVMVGGLASVVAVVRRPETRLRALAVVCGLAAIGLLLGAIGFGRAGYGDAPGFADRYGVFGATALCLSCMGSILAARRASFALLGLTAGMLLVALPANLRYAESYGTGRASVADLAIRDARRGLPSAVIARKTAEQLYPPSAEALTGWLEMLRAQRSSLFAGVDASPCRVREEVPIDAITLLHDIRPDGAGWTAEGDDPYLALALPGGRSVCAVEVTFVLRRPDPRPVTLEVFWKRDTRDDFAPGDRTDRFVVTPTDVEQTVTVWVGEPIAELRLDLAVAPCGFELRRVVVRRR